MKVVLAALAVYLLARGRFSTYLALATTPQSGASPK